MSIYEDLRPGDFAKSTKKRLPICFCLDTSGSMIAPTASGKTRIKELNDAFSKQSTHPIKPFTAFSSVSALSSAAVERR